MSAGLWGYGYCAAEKEYILDTKYVKTEPSSDIGQGAPGMGRKPQGHQTREIRHQRSDHELPSAAGE